MRGIWKSLRPLETTFSTSTKNSGISNALLVLLKRNIKFIQLHYFNAYYMLTTANAFKCQNFSLSFFSLSFSFIHSPENSIHLWVHVMRPALKMSYKEYYL